MSSTDTGSDDEYNFSDEEVTEELKAGYKKVKDELYQIRKRQQKPVFDPTAEEPRIIDLLRETDSSTKPPRYDESSWEDTKFFCVVISILCIILSPLLSFKNVQRFAILLYIISF